MRDDAVEGSEPLRIEPVGGVHMVERLVYATFCEVRQKMR